MYFFLKIIILMQVIVLETSYAKQTQNLVLKFNSASDSDLKKLKVDAIDFILKNRQSRLVIFGESHYDWKSKKIVTQIIEEIASQDAKFNCHFLEEGENAQSALDASKKTFNEFKSEYKQFNERLNKAYQLSIQEQYRAEDFLSYSFLKQIADSGSSLIAVDYIRTEKVITLFKKAEIENNKGNSYLLAKHFIRDRNYLMSNNIKKHLVKRSRYNCQKGTFVVGRGHLYHEKYKELKLFPIQNLLSNLNPVTVNVSQCSGYLYEYHDCGKSTWADLNLIIVTKY